MFSKKTTFALVIAIISSAAASWWYLQLGDGKAPKYENPALSDPHAESMRLRNEGLAFFERQDYENAMNRFRAAYRLNAASAADAFNLALTCFQLNRLDQASAYLQESVALNDNLANAHYLSGVIKTRQGEADAAERAFTRAKSLAPTAASPYFQLALLYRAAGDPGKARQALVHALQFNPYHQAAYYQLAQLNQSLDNQSGAESAFSEFERLRRATDRTNRGDSGGDDDDLARPVIDKASAQPPAPRNRYSPAFVLRTFADYPSTVLALLAGEANDYRPQIVIATPDGAIQFLEWRAPGMKPAKQWPTPDNQPVKHILVEHFSTDAPARILTAGNAGIAISEQGIDQNTTGWQRLSREVVTDIQAMDFDHDGDLDILTAAPALLFLNNGNGGFSPLESHRLTATLQNRKRLLVGNFANHNGFDIVAYSADNGRLFLEDQMGGQYRPSAGKPPAPGGIAWLRAADIDNTGRLDLIGIAAGKAFVERNGGNLEFQRLFLDGDSGQAVYSNGAVADFDNDGYQDLMLFTADRVVLYRNSGDGQRFDRHLLDLVPAGNSTEPVVYDYNGDGRLDLLFVASGRLSIMENASAGTGNAFQLDLRGRRSPPGGRGAEIEVRKGSHYAAYRANGLPVHVGLGDHDYAEVVRIRWPNGFVENKFKVDAGKQWRFVETERISGSCPSIFSWNGSRFEFVTDAFISGPMGVPLNATEYFPVDDDEYIKIAAGQLRARDGRYEIRITEELREAVFLDRVRLLAVDRPAGVDMYPNERLAPPPFPEFRIHLSDNAVPPATAMDHHGRDVSRRIAAVDDDYTGPTQPSQYTGLAEPNGVEFELPPAAVNAEQLRLFLTGWFYYFDSTSIISVSQRNDLKIIWPQIQVQTASGDWRTLAHTGIPPGKGKTLVVDLSGKLPADTRRLRLWSNIELYWDRIAVDTSPPRSDYRLGELPLVDAQLRLRGFSTLISGTARSSPERFDYRHTTFKALWNPLQGLYTRYGPVKPLLEQVDSRFAVMGSGDELTLSFETGPPVAAGLERDFLLYLGGYVKDGDKYTAHAGRLAPLPFAGMSSYPYPDNTFGQSVFETESYLQYRKEYQTREPLVFTGPELAEP